MTLLSGIQNSQKSVGKREEFIKAANNIEQSVISRLPRQLGSSDQEGLLSLKEGQRVQLTTVNCQTLSGAPAPRFQQGFNARLSTETQGFSLPGESCSGSTFVLDTLSQSFSDLQAAVLMICSYESQDKMPFQAINFVDTQGVMVLCGLSDLSVIPTQVPNPPALPPLHRICL